MNFKKKIFALTIFFIGFFSFADEVIPQKINETTYFYTLENGLSLFVSENHTVPLTYIEIAIRAGAITQDKNNAGIFHLYEHMMFKANSRFDNSAKVQKALSDMGTASWNGTTGIECVNYFFTIPNTQLENGLEFWNAAIREPFIDDTELEIEKKVVISEIQGNESNPDRYTGAFVNRHLFPNAPWQLDPSGSVENIQNATVEILRDIQQKYYIPSNAALFIAGDVEHQNVYELVKRIYGSWKNNDVEISQIENVIAKQTKVPFEKPYFCVIPYDKISEQFSQVNILYRGPDSDFDEQDTYPADMLSFAMENPDCNFVKEFVTDEKLFIPSSDYLGTGYSTRRRTGITSFNCSIICPPEEVAQTAVYFQKKVNDYMAKLLTQEKIVSDSERNQVLRQLQDNRVLETESFRGAINLLRYEWVTNSIEYYKTYSEKISAVTEQDIKSYIEKYIVDKNPLVIVYINLNVYEQVKKSFEELGFEKVESSKAFWWQK